MKNHDIRKSYKDDGTPYRYFVCKKGEYDFKRQMKLGRTEDDIKYCPFCGDQVEEEF